VHARSKDSAGRMCSVWAYKKIERWDDRFRTKSGRQRCEGHGASQLGMPPEFPIDMRTVTFRAGKRKEVTVRSATGRMSDARCPNGFEPVPRQAGKELSAMINTGSLQVTTPTEQRLYSPAYLKHRDEWY
jgi:hypothetical protein